MSSRVGIFARENSVMNVSHYDYGIEQHPILMVGTLHCSNANKTQHPHEHKNGILYVCFALNHYKTNRLPKYGWNLDFIKYSAEKKCKKTQ